MDYTLPRAIQNKKGLKLVVEVRQLQRTSTDAGGARAWGGVGWEGTHHTPCFVSRTDNAIELVGLPLFNDIISCPILFFFSFLL